MIPAEGISFTKMSGGGNDFIVLSEDVAGMIPDLDDLVRRVCRRGLSIGADGLLVVGVSTGGELRLAHRNPDGSGTALCGNGTRCAARWAWSRQLAPEPVRIRTGAGTVVGRKIAPEEVGLEFGLNSPPPEALTLEAGGPPVQGYVVTVGIPHFLIEVPDVDQVPVYELGARVRNDAHFRPEGTNVSFLERLTDGGLRIRTFERGVEAETLSCGTASVAAGVLAVHLGWSKRSVVCQTRSGIPLTAAASPAATGYADLALAGDARVVYEGRMEPGAALP